MNALILYYSRSGNTEQIAKHLHSDLGFDMLKIEPEDQYGNYIMSCFRVMKEKRQPVPPAFSTPIPDLSQYDTLFLGYPMWAQDMPMFVQDFVSKCDTSGKTIIPFATYGMSGISWSQKTLQRLFPDSIIKLPFDSGVFKKGNYEKWLTDIKALL